MPRKPHRAQVSFDSLLESDVPLDPRVILVDDPRWPQALRDVAATPYCGLDVEFYDDSAASGGEVDEGDGREGLDPYTSTIRLIQVALPDGRVLVADLGGVHDDRSARARLYGDQGDVETVTVGVGDDVEVVSVPLYVPGSFFDVVRDLVESETRPKILHHAKIDSLILRIRMGWRLRGARCTMLASQLYWAGVKFTKHNLGALSERAVAAGALGCWVVKKTLQRSEWRWKLSNSQMNYGALDAVVVIPIFKWLGGLIAADGMTAACQSEFAAIAGFVDCEFRGMPVNPAMLDDHIEMWQRGRELAIQPFRARYPGVDPAKVQQVAVALSLDECYGGYVFYELDEARPRQRPVTILGQQFHHAFKKHDDRYGDAEHTVAEAVLSRWSSLPWVSALLDWRSMGVILKWMESIRRRLHRDARVRGEYAQIAGGEGRNSDSDAGKGMGRAACRQPSLQQSASPQPKLSKLIHRAMGFVGEPTPMSPRIPFVPHDDHGAAYLRWAVARLRGEADDPFAGLKDGGATAKQQVASWSEATEDDEVDCDANSPTDADLPQDVAARIAWYEGLAAEWESKPRCLVVADFSQAHMRIAAQASQDPQLLEDFQQDRDAHLKLAFDFGAATKQLEGVSLDDFFRWYDKGHPKQKAVKSLRQPAKTGNYTSLNLGSVGRLKGAGDTAKPPVVLPYEQWEIIRDAWRRRYVGLFTFQKEHIKRCNSHDVLIDGSHYGVAWELVAGGRLYLKKEPDKFDKSEPRYCADCGRTHGRLTVKGTDAVSFVWMRSEKSALAHATGKIVADFDRHDAYFMARRIHPMSTIWDAHMGNSCHDEADCTGCHHYAQEIAGCVRRRFAEGLRWTGLTDVPPEPREAKDSDLVVGSWADK